MRAFELNSPPALVEVVRGLEALGYKLLDAKGYGSGNRFILAKGAERLYSSYYTTMHPNRLHVTLGLAAYGAKHWYMRFGSELPRTFQTKDLPAYIDKIRAASARHGQTVSAVVNMVRERMKPLGGVETVQDAAKNDNYYGHGRWLWEVPVKQPHAPGSVVRDERGRRMRIPKTPNLVAFSYVDIKGRLVRLKICVQYRGKVIFNRFEHIKSAENAAEILRSSWPMFVSTIEDPDQTVAALQATDPELVRKLFRRYKNRPV